MKKLLCVAAVLAASLSGVASAQEKYLGEVFLTAATFCPDGTFEANGQTIAVSTNTALFSLLGTSFGGNGTTTFVLPDLRGRVPVGVGQAPDLSLVALGDTGGSNSVSLTTPNLPAHNHSLMTKPVSVMPSFAGALDTNSGDEVQPVTIYSVEAGGGPSVQTGPTGINLPVEIRTPFVGIRYCVVGSGIYPVRP